LRTAKSEATLFPSALPQSAIIFWFHTSPKLAAISQNCGFEVFDDFLGEKLTCALRDAGLHQLT
jgi:hypothetical protein